MNILISTGQTKTVLAGDVIQVNESCLPSEETQLFFIVNSVSQGYPEITFADQSLGLIGGQAILGVWNAS